MSTEKVLIDKESPDREKLEALLEVMTKSTNRKKILVRFKFKYVSTVFLEWLTCNQYNALKTIDSLEFCRTTDF
jgi:hypothetical protein